VAFCPVAFRPDTDHVRPRRCRLLQLHPVLCIAASSTEVCLSHQAGEAVIPTFGQLLSYIRNRCCGTPPICVYRTSRTTSAKVFGSGGRASRFHGHNSCISVSFRPSWTRTLTDVVNASAARTDVGRSPISPHPVSDFDSFNCMTVCGVVVSY